MKSTPLLLVFMLFCVSCQASEIHEGTNGEVAEEMTSEEIATAVDTSIEEKEGYIMPEDLQQTIARLSGVYSNLKIDFDKMMLSAEVLKQKMVVVHSEALSECNIFLAGIRTDAFPNGIPKADMKNWTIDDATHRIRRTGN